MVKFFPRIPDYTFFINEIGGMFYSNKDFDCYAKGPCPAFQGGVVDLKIRLPESRFPRSIPVHPGLT
jgi:hypothetical protein